MIISNETENLVDANEFEKEFGESESRNRARWGTFGRVLVFTVALFATLIPVSVGEVHVTESETQIDRYLKVHGYYAMNAQELLEIVRQKNIEAYWAGPIVGARYVLDASEANRVTIRYLFNGESVDDIDSGKRVISTYHVDDGFSVVEKASTLEGTFGLSTVDGNKILFYQESPKNVYLGIKGQDVEIEIYDEEPGRALQLAIAEGRIRKV